MGYDTLRVCVKVISIVFILLGSLAVTISGPSSEAEAAPNPIPIVSVSLYPPQQEAKVDHSEGDAVSFGGNCTVEQMQFITSTVTLTCAVDENWSIILSPEEMIFTNPGTKRFTVTVIVPLGVPDGKRANVHVTASCKVAFLAPVVGSTSGVITVKNTSPTPSWDIKIDDPQPGEIYTTDDITISGTVSYNLGNITSVEVKVCIGQWFVATGTTEWTIDYDCAFLDDGEHSIYVRARSGEDNVSPTTEIKVIQDRSADKTDPSDGNAVPDDTGQEQTDLYTYLLVGILIIGGLGIGYWYYNRRQRDELAYLTNYY